MWFYSIDLTLSVYNYVGSIPSSLCSITSLTELDVNDGGTNPLVTCTPQCLTTVSNLDAPAIECPDFQDDAVI